MIFLWRLSFNSDLLFDLFDGRYASQVILVDPWTWVSRRKRPLRLQLGLHHALGGYAAGAWLRGRWTSWRPFVSRRNQHDAALLPYGGRWTG